jgi:hypothetical protein
MTGIRLLLVRCASLFTLAAVVLLDQHAYAQSLNPNPLQPAGVGSANDVDLSRGDLQGGGKIGRNLGAGSIDANPADTLLKEINGSNNGRRTGRSFLGSPRRRTTGFRGNGGVYELGAVRFDKRGTYEEAIYGSRAGSYSNPAKRRNPQ